MRRENYLNTLSAVMAVLIAGGSSFAAEGKDAPAQGAVTTRPAVTTAASVTREAGPETATTASGLIRPGERLTLDRCLEIGLRQSPAIAAADSTLNAAGARVGQAQSVYYPQVNLTGSYDAFALSTDPTNDHQDLYQGTASLSQMIFDFGRTPSQVRIQRLNEDASRSDRRNTVSQVVFNVKQAYYNLLQTEKNRDVAIDTVKLTQDQLDQAQGFFDAGVKSKYDVTSAEVNLSNAKLALIRAENAVKVARVTLNNAMGMPDAPEFEIEDTLAFQKNLVTYQDAVQRAYTNRPDLLALQARRDASRESISLARTGYYPALSGTANYTRADDHYVPERSGWSAGVMLTVPLFSGFLTKYQVKEAGENLNTSLANEETLRQSILLDVQQAYLNLRALEDGVAVAELTVRQAQENYDIVNGRYAAGVGSPLDVTNALVGLANARVNYIAALANYKVAEAALLKAMGE
jgi:TolC family type I secretion outer membrane protein